MSEELQQDAIAVATEALEKYNIEKDVRPSSVPTSLCGVQTVSELTGVCAPQIAAYIKKEFDRKHVPTWHGEPVSLDGLCRGVTADLVAFAVVVGRNFGSYVTHESGHFLYFYLGGCWLVIALSWAQADMGRGRRDYRHRKLDLCRVAVIATLTSGPQLMFKSG